MNYELIVIISAWASVVGFLWMIHRDIVSLRERMASLELKLNERMARLEGAVDVLKDLFRSSVAVKPQ